MEQRETYSLLRRGIAAAKSGDKTQARNLLRHASRVDPHCEDVWLWLARVAVASEEAIGCLEKALAINPFNQRARASISRIRSGPQTGFELRSRTSDSVGRSGIRPSARDSLQGAPVRRSWRCPICAQWFIIRPIRCVRCQSVQSLADVRLFFEDAEVDSELLQDAIERLQDDRARDPSTRHRTLALAHLNLRRYQRALVHLSAAAALSPREASLSRTAYELLRRLSWDQSPARPRRRPA